MTAADPIRRVAVVSTGRVRIRPDHAAGTWRPPLWWLLTSRNRTTPRPVNVSVIEHLDVHDPAATGAGPGGTGQGEDRRACR